MACNLNTRLKVWYSDFILLTKYLTKKVLFLGVRYSDPHCVLRQLNNCNNVLAKVRSPNKLSRIRDILFGMVSLCSSISNPAAVSIVDVS